MQRANAMKLSDNLRTSFQTYVFLYSFVQVRVT